MHQPEKKFFAVLLMILSLLILVALLMLETSGLVAVMAWLSSIAIPLLLKCQFQAFKKMENQQLMQPVF